jgi:hypothetical protein
MSLLAILGNRMVKASWTTGVSKVGSTLRLFSTVPPPNLNLEEEYKTEINDILDEYKNRKERKQSKLGRVVSTKNAKTVSSLPAINATRSR